MTYDVKEKARELTKQVRSNNRLFNDAVELIEAALTEARNAALEEAAQVAEGHIDYLSGLLGAERFGGRIKSAGSIASQIRNLKGIKRCRN